MEPAEFIITDTDELIVPNSGLALIGKLLAATKIAKRADSLALPRKPRLKVLHSDVLHAMIGLLCLAKSGFGDIAPFYENPFFTKALGLRLVPNKYCAEVLTPKYVNNVSGNYDFDLLDKPWAKADYAGRSDQALQKHGTSEQFHSEIKTDLDLERLPSGRFTVNALVLTCGMVAYNALRLINCPETATSIGEADAAQVCICRIRLSVRLCIFN